MNLMLTLTYATERDIDLLLIEEFAASPLFANWFFGRIGISAEGLHEVSVLHSTRRMHNRREIDITVEANTTAGRVLLLIENKLDTDEQVNQAVSYRDEALQRAASFRAVRAVLVCPESYVSGHRSFAESFDCTVPYEDVAGFFEARAEREQGEIARRCAHRGQLMRQAIEKARRGYVQVIHPGKKAFADRYVALLHQSASPLVPGPSMLRDSGAESVTMIFAGGCLPNWPVLPRLRIVHQLREGNANVNFYGWGDYFTLLAERIAPALNGTGFRSVPSVNKRRNGRSGLMIVADTPKVDQYGDFDEQIAAIRVGVAETERLRQWVFDHKQDLEDWARLVREES